MLWFLWLALVAADVVKLFAIPPDDADDEATTATDDVDEADELWLSKVDESLAFDPPPTTVYDDDLSLTTCATPL